MAFSIPIDEKHRDSIEVNICRANGKRHSNTVGGEAVFYAADFMHRYLKSIPEKLQRGITVNVNLASCEDICDGTKSTQFQITYRWNGWFFCKAWEGDIRIPKFDIFFPEKAKREIIFLAEQCKFPEVFR